jgi:hypothetical protein
MTHTPGPWIVFNGDGSFGVLPAGRPGEIAECKNTHDARLIAAAPDMLDALRLINKITSPGTRTLDDFIRDMGWACDEARRAIAKAEGRS